MVTMRTLLLTHMHMHMHMHMHTITRQRHTLHTPMCTAQVVATTTEAF